MKKKWIVFLIIVVAGILILSLSTCAAPISDDEVSDMDPRCTTGLIVSPVRISWGYRAFIVHPNEGCDLPTQYCILVMESRGGGMSCTTIEP